MPPARILCVDDQRITHRMYEDLLKPYLEQGTEILHAYNGWEAMMHLADQPLIDLILLDINMPVMNGLAFLDQLRKTPFSRIPVVIISTEGNNQSEVALGLELGALACLPKPFTFEQIQQIVERQENEKGKD